MVQLPVYNTHTCTRTRTHTHTHLMALSLGLPRWAGTRKVKPIWILLKQETVSVSGIRWAICKSAHHSRQITTPAPHHSVFYRPDALPAAQPTASKHWTQLPAYKSFRYWLVFLAFNVLIFSNNGLWFYCHNVVPQYVLTFICFRPALCFILVYNCGLTVHNKRICYVVLCYVMFVSTLFLMQFRISELTNNRHPFNSFVFGITGGGWY